MDNDLLGGLGGLMKGLSGFMPQDDPAVKLMNSQTEVSDLKKQEEKLYAEIGRKAVQIYGLDTFEDIAKKLRLVQCNLAAAQEKLDTTKSELEARENAEKAEKDARLCSSCGHENPEGTKFCEECGTKLGAAAKSNCSSCGVELASGTRFCGECGAKQ